VKYAVEMGSGGMIYIPSFMTIGSGIQTLLEGERRADTHSKVIPQSYIYILKIREAD
jgi:hypothetical protein